MDFPAIGFHRRRSVRLCTRGGVLQQVAVGLRCLPDRTPFQIGGVRGGQALSQRYGDDRPVPEILLHIVLLEPLAKQSGLADVGRFPAAGFVFAEQEIHANLSRFGHVEEMLDQVPRYLDDTHDASGDFRHPDALRISIRQEYLDGLWMVRHRGYVR